MNEEEIIKNIKEMIQWSDYNTYKIALQGILDLYNKEKEKNNSISIQYEKVVDKLEDLEQIEKEHKEENGRLRKEIDNKDNTIEQLQKEAGYKKCKLCKKVFKAKRKNQIYCSERCCNIVMCRNYKRRNRDKTLTYAKEYYKKNEIK